jgi:hypothetical protein
VKFRSRRCEKANESSNHSPKEETNQANNHLARELMIKEAGLQWNMSLKKPTKYPNSQPISIRSNQMLSLLQTTGST